MMSDIGAYILDSKGNPVLEPDTLKWGKWMESADRKVARDKIGAVMVSTVFLGLDHNFGFEGPPELYETMIFDDKNGEWSDTQERYATAEDARQGHRRWVNKVKKSQHGRDTQSLAQPPDL